MTDIRDALARADKRYGRRVGYDEPLTTEHLDALAAAVRPTPDDAPPADTPPADDKTIARQHGEITSLTLERNQLAEQLQATRTDFERREQAATKASEGIARTYATRNEELHKLLNDALRELTELRARETPHVHAYEWPAPDQPPLPCACGHPYPRTVLAEQLAHGSKVEPECEPFDVLMGRIRGELSTWGSPAQLKGVA